MGETARPFVALEPLSQGEEVRLARLVAYVNTYVDSRGVDGEIRVTMANLEKAARHPLDENLLEHLAERFRQQGWSVRVVPERGIRLSQSVIRITEEDLNQ